jgi:flavin-dependent dehydrogenase
VTAGAAERADAVVVGARPAGSATAAALARAGRRVIALDRAHFPSDTLSTHLMFAGGVVELARLGALERVAALGAPPLPDAFMAGAGLEVRGRYTPVEGIDYGMCVRRTGLDAALVDTARAAGADVRERARVTELVWEDGRVAGVRWRDADGNEHEIRAPLVVGADGRRSLVARAVGAERPYRSHPNGRACFYAYLEDPRTEWRATAAQWREGRELGTAFPCDGGLVMVLLMPPRERGEAFRTDLDAGWDATVAALPGLKERLEGCTRVTKVRSALDTTSYFRRSHGPGWALPGDAGHFKDPVTAQGIRDALRFGRRLGEATAPVLDDPARLDRALAAWERGRERECLETYHWTNLLGRDSAMTALEVELYRAAVEDPELGSRVLDVFARTRRPSAALPPGAAARVTGRTVRRVMARA